MATVVAWRPLVRAMSPSVRSSMETALNSFRKKSASPTKDLHPRELVHLETHRRRIDSSSSTTRRGLRHPGSPGEMENYSQSGYLSQYGVPVLFSDQTSPSKFMLVDGLTVLSSGFNFTNQAETANAEHMMVSRNRPDIYQSLRIRSNRHTNGWQATVRSNALARPTTAEQVAWRQTKSSWRIRESNSFWSGCNTPMASETG